MMQIQKRQLFPDGMIQFYYWGYVKNDNVRMNIKCQSSILRKGNGFSDYIKIIRIKDEFFINNNVIDYGFCLRNGDGDY